jgi:hypothetical protein
MVKCLSNNNLYFSDIFNVNEEILEKYGAMNISLVNDLPLFIDPFLLFNSENEEYKILHDKIIEYLLFLRDESEFNIDDKEQSAKLKAWYTFSEVKQNWLGFSLSGNSGRGLGLNFALELHGNLNRIFNDFGIERVTQSSHLEKLCIIGENVGRDGISDFTTNLVKDYLLNYTEVFAEKYLQPEQCKKCNISKVTFNYNTKYWESKVYYLPFINGDYAVLTPKNMLTRDDTFINKTDMSQRYDNIVASLPDDVLRFQINSYISEMLHDPNRKKEKEPTKKEREVAFIKAIKAYPVIIDYYIKYKEDNREEAIFNSKLAVNETEKLFILQIQELITLLNEKTSFYKTKINSYQEAMSRVKFLKHIIENCDGYRIFYIDGKPVKREKDLQIMYKLVWFASPLNVDSEVNNGRGPVDFKISYGSADSTLVELKLASNGKLKQNLIKQVEAYEMANNTTNTIKVILCFSDDEHLKVQNILRDLKVKNEEFIILIDAKNNKLSASNIPLDKE